MSLKTLLTTLTLSLLPIGAYAQCGHSASTQAMSCAEGTQWDEASATCIPVTTS